MTIDTEQNALVGAGVKAGLDKYESSDYNFVPLRRIPQGVRVCRLSSLFHPEWHFLSCSRPYHCGSVIPVSASGQRKGPPVESLARAMSARRQPGASVSRRVVMGVWQDRNYRRSFEPNQVEKLQNSGKQEMTLQPTLPKRVRPCIALNLGKQVKMLSTVQAANKLKQAVGQHDFKGWYRFQYLKSDHWRKLRAEKLKSAPVCEICRNNSAEQVHHLRYRSIYDVGLTDLQSVCRSCHCGIHSVPIEEKPEPFWAYRERIETEERENEEAQKKLRAKRGKGHKLSGDAQTRYAGYLEKTAPFKFRGNRY